MEFAIQDSLQSLMRLTIPNTLPHSQDCPKGKIINPQKMLRQINRMKPPPNTSKGPPAVTTKYHYLISVVKGKLLMFCFFCSGHPLFWLKNEGGRKFLEKNQEPDLTTLFSNSGNGTYPETLKNRATRMPALAGQKNVGISMRF
ncbi:MAG: hypothetical protein ISS70_04775 [Phycisphaerae bacterium]|nr:hypothetical protein [Phycisphaerae bacterium]